MMAEVYELNAWRHQLQQGDRGPKKNLTNLMLHLRNLDGLGKSIRFNEAAHQVEWQGRPIKDTDLIDIRLLIERAGFQPAEKDVKPAVERVAIDNVYNPITDYLDGLAWDGTPRLDRWMPRLLGAEDTPYVRKVGAKTLIAAVARARVPGCKVDTVLVLEGPQGLKKSTAIATLFGEDYTAESVSLFDQHNKMVMQMMGAWVVELAEFVAIARKDQSSVKGLLSMRSDRVVLPYAKMASTHPRRCIFFATVNPEEGGYLTDSTGNRRYWPVAVTKIDLEGIALHRDQIWAEAQARYRDGEHWWLDQADEAAAQAAVAGREEDDVWEPVLASKLQGRDQITPAEVLSLLGVPYDRMDRRQDMRAAKVMKKLGFISKTPKDENRKTYRVWQRASSG
ncbi:VapE domain-containing protein [Sphingomonas sp.]|uniref:VapE domain-containing protein n=1 Tax=Sphingomonas sp. TaxID=28214 RepID=UPI003F6E6774